MAGQDIAVRHNTVTLTTQMTMIAGEQLIAVAADLRYSSRDTYAVRLSLSIDDSPAVEWIFARDLLRDGLLVPAGAGDIQIFPVSDGVVIDLISPHGRARLLMDADELASFVQDMHTVVGDGDEDRFFSMDHELNLLVELLGSKALEN